MVAEDLARANWEQQLQELVALSAIYGDKFRILSAGGQVNEEFSIDSLLAAGSPTQPLCLECEAFVEVDVPPSGLRLVVPLEHGQGSAHACGNEGASASSRAAVDCNSSRNSGADTPVSSVDFGKVHYLPPIRLDFTFPATYPSSQPPIINSLHAAWLCPTLVAQLRAALQQQWDEAGPGLPICFTWLEFLKASALEHVGIVDILALRRWQSEAPHPHPSAEHHSADGASSSSSSSSRGDMSQAAENTASTVVHRCEQCNVAATSSTSRKHAATGTNVGGGKGSPLLEACNGCEGQGRHPSIAGSSVPSEVSSADGRDGNSDEDGSGSAHSHLSPSQLPDQIAMNLLCFSAQAELIHFQQQTWRWVKLHIRPLIQHVGCSICFEDVQGSKCMRLPECHHHFCQVCFLLHCRTKVQDGAVDSIQCPDPTCRKPVLAATLQALLSEEEYARWESLLLQQTLDRMEDVVYCPRCEMFCIEDKDHCAQCPRCLFVFCSLCDESWHPGTACVDPQTRLELLSRRKQRGPGTEADRRRREVDLVNQMKSLAVVMNSTQACPRCQMAIDKAEGCNKMRCSYCNTLFCWKCREIISGYEHFGDNKCKLFDQAEVDRWNAFMGGARYQEVLARGHIVRNMAHQAGVRTCHCPVCGQMNLKEGGNNLIRCWSCAQSSCFLCRQWLRGRRPGAHFSPSGCKQHTFD